MTRIWPLPCEGLGNNSYLAEVGSGLALAVDPGRDPRPYLGLAAAHGLRVAFTADTHVHADFVSGGRELAAGGARLLAPAGSGLSFPHEQLRDGEALDLGGLTLRALATPGHTPEHLSYLLLDGAAPVAVFTGGALIAGGVARTDLADCRSHAKTWHFLRRTKMPAVRIDVGYITNPGDAGRLSHADFRDVVAEAIAVAVQRVYLPPETDPKTGVLRWADLREALRQSG